MKTLTTVSKSGSLDMLPRDTTKMSDLIAAVEKSDNLKIGPCSCTWVAQISCPPSCPHMNSGCYAESGTAAFTTNRLNRAARDFATLSPGAVALIEAAGIDTLTGRRDLRLHVVGDARTNRAAQILSAAADRYIARGAVKGKTVRVWTYTHARDTRRESWGRISVLRSCETIPQVRAAHTAGFAAAIVIPEHVNDRAYKLDNEFTGIPCPEQTGRAENCISCGLCMQDSKLHARKMVIVFAAHGQGKKKMLHLKTV